jgi:hypothetical protein
MDGATIKVLDGDIEGPAPKERDEVVVDSTQVAVMSGRGYRTIAIVDEEIATTLALNDSVMNPGMSYPTPVMKTVAVTQKILRFHMVRDGASHIAEFSAQLETAKAVEVSLDQKLEAARKENVQLKGSSDMLTRDIERCRAQLEEEQKITAEQRERLRKMEADIARFRKEIGEQRWRELCEEPKK